MTTQIESSLIDDVKCDDYVFAIDPNGVARFVMLPETCDEVHPKIKQIFDLLGIDTTMLISHQLQ
jgi:hypothetical protein